MSRRPTARPYRTPHRYAVIIVFNIAGKLMELKKSSCNRIGSHNAIR